MNEGHLVRRLQQGDDDAFREMVCMYQQRVFNLVYRMLGNAEEAEDLTQEVFITVFKSIDSFRGDSKFSTWLYRITVNHCKNRYKYLARRHFHAAQSLDMIDRHFVGTDGKTTGAFHTQIDKPDELFDGKNLGVAIQRELAALDEEHRVLIILRDIQGLSYQQIGEITKLPEGTIKSRLHRARMVLKEKLGVCSK